MQVFRPRQRLGYSLKGSRMPLESFKQSRADLHFNRFTGTAVLATDGRLPRRVESPFRGF